MKLTLIEYHIGEHEPRILREIELQPGSGLSSFVTSEQKWPEVLIVKNDVEQKDEYFLWEDGDSMGATYARTSGWRVE